MSSQWSDRTSRVLSSGLFILLVGCSTVPLVPRIASAQADSRADTQPGTQPGTEGGEQADTFSSEDSQLMYELLVSELAIRRGELAVAAEGYLRATERTDDPRVAERATQLAVYYQDWEQAITTAKRWLLLDPDAVSAYETLAQIQLRQMDQAGAVDTFKNWIEASNDKAATFQSINALLSQEREPQFAFDVSTEFTQYYPDEPLTHIGRANLALSSGNTDDALQSAEKALVLDPASVDASLIKAQVQIVQGEPSAALETLEAAVSLQPDSFALHIGFAQLLVDSELYDRAGPVLDRAGELSEGDSDTWLRLGLLSLQSIRYEQAQKFLEGVLADDPLNERANVYLARIADTRHDNAAAIAYFDAVPDGEFYITSRLRAAELAAESGDIDGGIERLRELATSASDPAVKVELISSESRILQQADRGDEAIAVLNTGLETYPDNTSLLYSRALAGERVGRDQIFEDDLATILSIDPDNAHALNALGYHFAVNNKRLSEAAAHLERASELEPNDAAIMDSLGWLRFRQGKLEAAKDLLTQAYAIFPDAEIAAHLGEVLWAMGDESAARSVWAKALASEPDHEVLNAVMSRFVEK